MPIGERQQRGLDFEQFVADKTGQKVVKGSGASYRSKSDVRGRIRISAKAEEKKSWNRIREQLWEAIEFAMGTGEHPALAVLDDDNEAFIFMRLDDFVAVLTDGTTLEPVQSRGDVVRKSALTPSLLR